METGIQDRPHHHHHHQPHWDRCERADLFAQYQALRMPGFSERQAAKARQGPRTTLPAWRLWHETLESGPHVAAFLQSGPGLAFFHRLVIACHLVCVEVGACGMRIGCLFLNRTGLDRFVAASYGAQQHVNGQGEHAIVDSRHRETARLATDMPHTDRTVTQDDTCPGGLCLGTMDPDSHDMIVEQSAQARDHTMWHACMAPALAPRNCRVIPSTSDAAPGLLASVAPSLEAHHSPDLFHGQHELVKAVSGPMATTERTASKAVTTAREQLDRLHSDAQSTGEASAQRGPGHPPKAAVSLEHAAQALDAARRAYARRAQQREHVQARLRSIGHDDHVVDLERGVRRHGPRIAADIHAHSEQRRTIAQQEGLSPRCLDRLEHAERVVPKRQATSALVSGYVRQQVAQLDGTPPVSFAMHAKRIPAYDLARVAQTRRVSDGEPLRALAERLRAPWCAPGGVFYTLSPETPGHLHDEAKRLATVFQRSSAHVEGRNGSLSLRNHQLRGLHLPRKREGFTALHHFFLPRPDGTTAAERFFGQKPRSMFAAILESVELAPAPLSPPRKA